MIRAGIKEVMDNLSRRLGRVKEGEEILITERGRPVARVVKEGQGDRSVRAVLGPLIQKGLVTLTSRSILREHLSALEAPGKPVSDMVLEDRRRLGELYPCGGQLGAGLRYATLSPLLTPGRTRINGRDGTHALAVSPSPSLGLRIEPEAPGFWLIHKSTVFYSSSCLNEFLSCRACALW